MIKFVSHLRQVGGFLRVPPSIKPAVIEILLKAALNTIIPLLIRQWETIFRENDPAACSGQDRKIVFT